MTYPGSLDSFSTKVDSTSDVMAADVNGLQTALVNVETALGTNPQGSATDLKTRLNRVMDAYGNLDLKPATTLTISAGVITTTQNYHRVETEAGASSDDLTTITAPAAEGFVLFLRMNNTSHKVTIKNATGNILCFGGNDISMTSTGDGVMLIYDATLTAWLAIGGGSGGGGGGSGNVSMSGLVTPGHMAAIVDSTHIGDGGAIPSGTGNVFGAASVASGDLAGFDTDGYHLKSLGSIAGITSGNDFVYNISGTLTAGAGQAAYVASRNETIQKVYLYSFTLGASGSTIVDIHKNGTTIFTTQANRASLPYNDADGVAVSGIPEVTALVAGDVLTIDLDAVATGASGLVVVVAINPGATSGGGGPDYILIQDQKTLNTDGGTFTSGAWRTRDLNTKQADDGGHASVASNQITLAAGTYRCKISAPAMWVNNHKAKLRDITNSADILIGTAAWCASTNGAVTNSIISGQFVLTGSTVLEVQHKCSTTCATTGFGTNSGLSDVEIYTVAEFWKVA